MCASPAKHDFCGLAHAVCKGVSNAAPHPTLQFLTSVLSAESMYAVGRGLSGGVHQRLKRARQEQQQQQPVARVVPSKLVALLLPKWAAGEYSPQQLQEITAAALEDVMTCLGGNSTIEEMTKLATLGTSGAYPNKCHQVSLYFLSQKGGRSGLEVSL